MKIHNNRKFIVKGIFIFIALVFLCKLFYIQVINDKYKFSAKNNVLRYDVKYPGRGLLYDRNNQLLAYNEASYDLMVVPREVEDIDSVLLSGLLNITIKEYDKRMKKAKKYSKYKESVFAKKIDAETFAKLQEMLYQFHGFFERTRSSRAYPLNTASNVMGYLGEVNNKIIKKDNYYTSGDLIGVSGVEVAYEKLLRGEKGMELVLVDVHNSKKGKFNEGRYDTNSVSGANITTTIDADLQKYGEQLMQNKIGSIVAIEPSSGEILSLISSPTYNPNVLTGRKRTEKFKALLEDGNKPLFNRALLGQYAPGSTFKLINGLIALQEKTLKVYDNYNCIGGYKYGNNKIMLCHEHSNPINLKKAVAISCNAYFCNAYQSFFDKYQNTEIAYNTWYNHVASFGVGQWMNNDFTSGKKGLLPKTDFYDNIYGRTHWNASTVLSLSIGQGELLLTPIQMANITAIIANRGYYFTPHIVKKIGTEFIGDEQFTKKKYTTIDPIHFKSIIDGMQMVLEDEDGTAKNSRVNDLIICGKTGTAQNTSGNKEDHSIFIAFAPKDNPKIAIAVYVENGGFGSTWAAPIATLMIEKYLRNEIINKHLEEFIFNGNLILTK
ncbi:MAG: penicillin-binding protein 2 [Flavobacteriales bacterium]|nr:penicillin-binding protein 2 [Flavobacteriales bacterium]